MAKNIPPNKSSFLFTADFVKNLMNIVVPSALFSAIGYYIGWSRTAAYYLLFGLSPSLIDKSVPEVLALARVELVSGILGLAVGFILYVIFDNWNIKVHQTHSNYIKVLLLFFSIIIATFISGYLTLTMWQFYAIERSYYFVIGAFVTGLWTTLLLGIKIVEVYELNKSTPPFLFRLFFPNSYIYITALLIVAVFLVSRLGHWRGSNEAIRDMQSPYSLIKVSLYAKDPLPIKGTYNPITKLYEYPGFRLIDINNEYMFITEDIVADPYMVKSFAIPKQEDIFLQLSP